MQAITTVGLDIAKSVFQVHGVDAAGKVIIRRQLKRRHVLPSRLITLRIGRLQKMRLGVKRSTSTSSPRFPGTKSTTVCRRGQTK
jgi:transposase